MASRIKPNFAEAFVNRGIARRAKGDMDRAIAGFDTAIRINPQFADAIANRAKALNATDGK